MSHVQPQPGPAAGGGTNSATSSDRGLLARRRQDLTLPLPQRDSFLAVPLPLAPCSSNSSSSSSANSTSSSNQSSDINFSELERANRVGSGTCGTAYKVIHRPTGRVYALKVIHGNHVDSVRRQICREIEILRDVNNPNVVKCHDMFDHNSEIQVLLEFMDGGSLEGTHIPHEPQLAGLAHQILTGLAYLHRRHIVHRDIKPSNLLINSRRQVKIADFGVGRILAQTMDPFNSSVGTIAYMSPERINTDLNHGGYDGYAGDIWSFGVSILEFYMGRFPFAVARQGDWASLMCAICMSQPPEAPPTASREFRDFISCCLRREPRRRWNALQLLRHPFILSNNQAQNHQLLPPPRSIDSQRLRRPSSLTNTPAQNQNVSRHVLSCGGEDGGGSDDGGDNDNGGGGGGVDKINLSYEDDDSNSSEDDDDNDSDFKSWRYEGHTSLENGIQLAKRHGAGEGDGNLESKTYPHIRRQPSASVRWYHYIDPPSNKLFMSQAVSVNDEKERGRLKCSSHDISITSYRRPVICRRPVPSIGLAGADV